MVESHPLTVASTNIGASNYGRGTRVFEYLAMIMMIAVLDEVDERPLKVCAESRGQKTLEYQLLIVHFSKRNEISRFAPPMLVFTYESPQYHSSMLERSLIIVLSSYQSTNDTNEGLFASSMERLQSTCSPENPSQCKQIPQSKL